MKEGMLQVEVGLVTAEGASEEEEAPVVVGVRPGGCSMGSGTW